MNTSNTSNNHNTNSNPTSHQEGSSSSFSFFGSQPQNECPFTHKDGPNLSPQDHPLPPSYPPQMTNVNTLNSIKAQEFSNLVDLNLLNVILSQKLHPPTMTHPTLAQVDAHGAVVLVASTITPTFKR